LTITAISAARLSEDGRAMAAHTVVALRASWKQDFAPTIPDLYTPSILAFTRRAATARCPITHLPSDCGTFFLCVRRKPDLGRNLKHSTPVSFGSRCGLSAGIDYWKIEKSERSAR
jgi:hypothetical protein